MRKEARENIHERGAESGHGVSCLVATQYMQVNLKQRSRLVVDTLMAIILIMILLLFTYVFGGSLAGSIQMSGAAKVNYVNYQLPEYY